MGPPKYYFGVALLAALMIQACVAHAPCLLLDQKTAVESHLVIAPQHA
jgi:hypothetical protein